MTKNGGGSNYINIRKEKLGLIKWFQLTKKSPLLENLQKKLRNILIYSAILQQNSKRMYSIYIKLEQDSWRARKTDRFLLHSCICIMLEYCKVFACFVFLILFGSEVRDSILLFSKDEEERKTLLAVDDSECGVIDFSLYSNLNCIYLPLFAPIKWRILPKVIITQSFLINALIWLKKMYSYSKLMYSHKAGNSPNNFFCLIWPLKKPKIYLIFKCSPPAQNSLCDFDAPSEEWQILAKFALINPLFMIFWKAYTFKKVAKTYFMSNKISWIRWIHHLIKNVTHIVLSGGVKSEAVH